MHRVAEELKALLETDLPKLLTAKDLPPLDKDNENNAPLFLDPDLSIFCPEVKSSDTLWLMCEKARLGVK